MYQSYNEQTSSVQDRIAWALCQIIDDDAPLRWARYRFAAECIARNEKLMTDLHILAEQGVAKPSFAADGTCAHHETFEEDGHACCLSCGARLYERPAA